MMVGPALRSFTLLAAASASTLAAAQVARPDEQVIIVTAPRSLPQPSRSLGREDIDGYGAGSIGELLQEIVTEEGEDSPVILINGKRASGLTELSDYPPEALERVEVLPVGSGPAVGASPTRKVVNLVLQRRFDGRIGRTAHRSATDGGWDAARAEGNLTRIRGDSRLNLTVRARTESALTEAERDIVQPAGSLPGEGETRTLLPSLRGTDLSLSAATQLGTDVDLSGTGRLSWLRRQALLGPGLGGDPREQRSTLLGGRISSTLNAEVAGWTLALLGSFDADRRHVTTDLDALGGTSRSLLRNRSGQLDLTAYRPLFALPAGSVQLNLGAGVGAERFESIVRRAAGTDRSRFTERSANGSAGLLVPIAGGPQRALRPLGELNLSADVGVSRVEGGGSFNTGSASLTWQPIRPVRLTAAISRASSPPATRFRREAVLATPGVLYFDPLTGQSIRVTELSGPLDSRVRSRTSQERVALSFNPRSSVDLRIDSDWSRRRERDIAGNLPLASAAVLAAFPERFVRDPSGQLVSVDSSPVLFAHRSESQWRNSLSLRFFLDRAAAARPARADSSEAGGGGEEEPAQRAGRTRLQLTLAHTLLLSSKLTLRDGLAPIDLLSRDAILFAGGRPRHQLDASANLSARGMGARLAANFRSASNTAVSSGAGGSQELRFGALATVSLRAFAEAGRLFGEGPLTRGTRLTLNIVNLGNDRERVRDRQGLTPLAYQPAFRDALGRTIELEVRRRF